MSMSNQFFQELIVKPFKRNLAGTLFLLGLLFTFLGAVFGKQIDHFSHVPEGTGEALLKGGSAILGAGVFAVIMKSSQFTELFQKHISAVFYDPSSVGGVPLIVKWRLITSALLKNVLPSAHNKAVELIEQQFFNSEREYHFEDHNITYEITVDVNTGVATIKHQTESIIVLSPHAKNPLLDQSIESEGGTCTLISLRLNSKDCNKTELFKVDANNPKLYKLTFPLKEYAVSSSEGSDQIVKLERVQSWTQNLKADPYMAANISRYIKGVTVKAKISAGYKLEFLKFGLGELPDNHYVADDGMGFSRWQLAEPNCLLLPGQGFIIIPVAL